MKILLSAFEPFGGEAINASLEAMKKIRPPAGADLKKIEIPTVFGLAGETLLKAVREEKPDVVICLGQASGRVAVTPERTAVNVRDAAIPDNAGQRPQDEPVVEDGPAAYFSTLPIRDMTEASLRAGFPAAVSYSAGTFVCNDLMYTLLHASARDYPAMRCGFIHVPACAAPSGGAQTPVMPTEMAAASIEAMLAVL